LGFLPKSDSKREELIKQGLDIESTVVIYESPNRLFKLLELIKDIDQTLYVCALRDITKSREGTYSDTVVNVIDVLERAGLRENPHGEWVVLTSKKI
jgi:16S rRNA (cytidine1402-2'-O)-methyltransferase